MMFKTFTDFTVPAEINGDCGKMEVSASLSIQESYYGTKVDDVKDFNPTELKDLDIQEIIFVSNKKERKLTKAEINEQYKTVEEYVKENIEDFLE